MIGRCAHEILKTSKDHSKSKAKYHRGEIFPEMTANPTNLTKTFWAWEVSSSSPPLVLRLIKWERKNMDFLFTIENTLEVIFILIILKLVGMENFSANKVYITYFLTTGVIFSSKYRLKDFFQEVRNFDYLSFEIFKVYTAWRLPEFAIFFIRIFTYSDYIGGITL